jgi:RNA polymerase sigma-70 factor (ECF subfamily)
MNDNDIIELYISRDEAAIAETSRKYSGYCKKIAFNIIGQKEDVDECVNDVYLTAWNTIPPQRPTMFGGFLAKITRNLAFDKYRKRNAKKRAGENMSVVLSELEECLPSSANVEAQYEAGQTAESINEFLSTLEIMQREIFVKRYWAGESVAKLAKEYGISYTKATSLLHRLRAKLKLKLESEGIAI